MKLAVVGNSHVAMLKAASQCLGTDGTEIVWMAAPGGSIRKLKIDNTVLSLKRLERDSHAQAAGLTGRIDLRDFDAVVLVGTTASANHVSYIMRWHVVAPWLSAEHVLSICEGHDERHKSMHFITEHALRDTMRAMIRGRVTYQWTSQIATRSDIPIFVVPQPRPHPQVLQETVDKYPVFKRIASLGVFEHLGRVLDAAHAAAFSDVPSVRVIAQPSATVQRGLFTCPTYMQGSIKLGTRDAHAKEDVLHANAAYGQLVWRDILTG